MPSKWWVNEMFRLLLLERKRGGGGESFLSPISEVPPCEIFFFLENSHRDLVGFLRSLVFGVGWGWGVPGRRTGPCKNITIVLHSSIFPVSYSHGRDKGYIRLCRIVAMLVQNGLVSAQGSLKRPLRCTEFGNFEHTAQWGGELGVKSKTGSINFRSTCHITWLPNGIPSGRHYMCETTVVSETKAFRSLVGRLPGYSRLKMNTH